MITFSTLTFEELNSKSRTLTCSALATLPPGHRSAQKHRVFEQRHADVEQHTGAKLNRFASGMKETAMSRHEIPVEELFGILETSYQYRH